MNQLFNQLVVVLEIMPVKVRKWLLSLVLKITPAEKKREIALFYHQWLLGRGGTLETARLIELAAIAFLFQHGQGSGEVQLGLHANIELMKRSLQQCVKKDS